MSGEELYTLYEGVCIDEDVGIDSWEDLPDDQKKVWNELGKLVKEA